MEFGDFRLALVGDGSFRLDGGAMFGVVPRTLWEKAKPPDAQNRIRLATNCLLIERGSRLALVDTGLGDKHDARFREIFGFDEGARRLPAAIAAAGYELGDVTHVISTHLHFDHCGWHTRQDDGGRLLPTFPRARYVLERGEVEHARRPNARDKASYDPRNLEPLFAAGVVDLFDGEAEPLPGVRAVKVPGHNADMCVVLVDGGAAGRAVFWADLVPTVAHLPYPWIMGYDLYPMQTLANKEAWLPRAAAEGWLCFFEHETDTPVGRLVEEKPGRYRCEPVPREEPAFADGFRDTGLRD